MVLTTTDKKDPRRPMNENCLNNDNDDDDGDEEGLLGRLDPE